MVEFFKKHHERLTNMLLWLLVLLPLVGCARLMRKYGLDQRFLDDWVWAIDLMKFKEGVLTWHDLFSVHLEHRPALPRALALAVTLLARGDVQPQLGLTLLWLAGSFGALCWLWVRRAGLAIRDAWLPLLLAGGILFTPVQWQSLLWPICCETMMPVLFLLLSLCCAFKSWPWWVRCLAGAGCAILGMLSFASGVLLWVLPLPVFFVCGAFPSNRTRWKFAALWGAVLTLTLLIHLQMEIIPQDRVAKPEKRMLSLPGNFALVYDLHNEVPPQYAYHHGEEDTMGDSLKYFLVHPGEDMQFIALFCGALTVRGWAADAKEAAVAVGRIYLAGLALLAFFCWRFRRDKELLANLLPMLCLGVYTPATGLLVAVGRIYAGHLHTGLNVRYSVHQTQIVIALVGGAFFLCRQLMRERPATPWRAAALVAGGLLAGVVGVGWMYGAAMMESWQAARFRNAAAQFVSQIFPAYNHHVAWVAGNHLIARDVTDSLDRMGMVRHRPLRDGKFSEITKVMRVSNRTLFGDRAMVHRLTKDANDDWSIEGDAMLPVSGRPADGLLLAWRRPGEEWKIWGFTQASGPPIYLPHAINKDMWGIVPGHDIWPSSLICPLVEAVAVREQPPPGAQISVWVMDMQRHTLHRMTRGKDAAPDEDGLTAEELAKPYDPPPEPQPDKK